MKNSRLCQRARCTNPVNWIVCLGPKSAMRPAADDLRSRATRRSWLLRLCNVHVQPYRQADDPAITIECVRHTAT